MKKAISQRAYKLNDCMPENVYIINVIQFPDILLASG